MADALAQVKRAMGHEAMILHTRTFRTSAWLGLRRREVVEITAGRDPTRRPRARGRAIAGETSVSPLTAPAPTRALATARSPASIIPAEPGRRLLETPVAGNVMIMGLSQEMGALKEMVQGLVSEIHKGKCPQVPEGLFEFYMKLIENDVADELATEIVKTLREQLRPEHLSQPHIVRQKLAQQLEKLLPTAGPIQRTRSVGPHVVALIGPTGVGKTTTIAKLAAHLKLREKHRVGLITIDTYRIAAIDQLRKYAEIIGSPLKVVGSPEDLREALVTMSDCDFVLIDTAGRSPNDTLKLNELKSFIAAANPDEVHLVLSTTASQQCVDLAVERFGEVRVDKVLFTKLDEAAHVGVVLNVMRKINKSLSYVTTGQNVPNDIEVGRGTHLAQLILGEPN